MEPLCLLDLERKNAESGMCTVIAAHAGPAAAVCCRDGIFFPGDTWYRAALAGLQLCSCRKNDGTVQVVGIVNLMKKLCNMLCLARARA